MSTSIRWPKPRYCVPLFVPLLKWFLGHKGTTRDTEGDKKQAVFIDVFYFVQENPKIKAAVLASVVRISSGGLPAVFKVMCAQCVPVFVWIVR
jgi:hypothetical protein